MKPKELKRKLIKAFQDSFHVLRADDLPKGKLREIYREIEQPFERKPGTKTIDEMSEDEVGIIIDNLLALDAWMNEYWAVERYKESIKLLGKKEVDRLGSEFD